MINITVEEIEIKVKANVNKVKPQINKMVKEVKSASTQMKKIFDPNETNFTTNLKREINGIIRETQKLKGKKYGLNDILDYNASLQKKKVNKKAESGGNYVGYDSDLIQSQINQISAQQIEKVVKKTRELKKELKNTNAEKLKKSVKQTVDHMKKVKSDIKNMHSGFNSIKNVNGKISGTIKASLKNVLRIMGSLIGIRAIYSGLRSIANSWLSSQNKQAQQLSTNLEYIKYSFGSALAPIISNIVNLIYQASKGIQSMIYALTGVNIFANASAKSFAKMTNNAKEMQGIADFDEIHNMQDDASDDSNSTPNIDLSNVGNTTGFFTTLGENIKNGNWGLIGQNIASGFNNAIKKAKKFVNKVDWSGLGTGISDGINGFFETFDFENFAKTLNDFIIGILTTISTTLEELDWDAIADGIVDFIKNVDWAGVIIAIFKGIFALREGCKEIRDTFIDDFIVKPIKEFFEGLWNSITDKGAEAWEKIKETFGSVGNWFKNVFSDAWEKVKEVFSSGGKIFDGIKEGILNGFKTVVNGIIKGINKVITIPFNGINSALSGIRGTEIAGWKPFSWLPTINTPQIPELARGGVLYNDTLIRAGEYSGARNNPEIVTPQNVMYDTMSKALKDNSRNNNIQVNGQAELIVNGKSLAKATIFDFDAEAQRRGYKPILQK